MLILPFASKLPEVIELSMDKPFSQACENNKAPILRVLIDAFAKVKTVLEIGSGTGQHAVYFAEHLPHVTWQPTDLAANLPGVRHWMDEAKLPNIRSPIILDVRAQPWPVQHADAIFTANSLHIMGAKEVELFFQGVENRLLKGGRLCVYGPFNYHGKFTSDSNARFNDWLYQQNPKSAIRNFEWVNELAEKAGLSLLHDHEMPANNRLLEWLKISGDALSSDDKGADQAATP